MPKGANLECQTHVDASVDGRDHLPILFVLLRNHGGELLPQRSLAPAPPGTLFTRDPLGTWVADQVTLFQRGGP